MRRTVGFVALLCAVTFVASGCGCGGGGGKDGISSSDTQKMSDLNDIATRVKGDFKLLKPEEKAKFIATYGSQSAAKRMMKMMVNPPNAKYKKKD